MTKRPKFQRRRKPLSERTAARSPVENREPPKEQPSARQEAANDLQALRRKRERLLAEQAAKEQQLEDLRRQEAEMAEAARRAEKKRALAKKPMKPLVLASPPEEPVMPPVQEAAPNPWDLMDTFVLDADQMERNKIITAQRTDPAYARFDVLRTRMLQALEENGWKRIAITSPTKDCGKTFVAANLAISLSRQENCRTVLLDLDMRSPSLHQIFGIEDPGSIGDFLRGEISATRQFQRIGANDVAAGSHVAIGFNGLEEPFASELLQDPTAERALKELEQELQPDVILFDLPPALLNDDVIALRPHFDAILLVVGGGISSAKDVKETERQLGEQAPLLGIVLNKSEDNGNSNEAY